HHLADRHVATAHGDLEPTPVGERKRFGRPGEPGIVGRLEAPALHLSGKDFLAEREADRLLLVIDPLLDLMACAGRANMAQPVATRFGTRAGENLHRIAAFE